MAGAGTLEAGDQGGARQRHVADGVQDLVADEFIRKPHQLPVAHRVAVNRQGVFQAGAMAAVDAFQIIQLLQAARENSKSNFWVPMAAEGKLISR